MHPLEERIGYKFRNSLLLAEALTHSSLGHETQRVHFDNQRLEYLGDAVLQVLVSEDLYRRFPDADEGILSRGRARLVSGDTLAVYAKAIHLGDHLILGRGDESSGGRHRISTLGDAFEALVGALYLDGGLAPARAFFFGAGAGRPRHRRPATASAPQPKGKAPGNPASLASRRQRPHGATQPSVHHHRASRAGSRAQFHRAGRLEWDHLGPRPGSEQGEGRKCRRDRRPAPPTLGFRGAWPGGTGDCRTSFLRDFRGPLAGRPKPVIHRQRHAVPAVDFRSLAHSPSIVIHNPLGSFLEERVPHKPGCLITVIFQQK